MSKSSLGLLFDGSSLLSRESRLLMDSLAVRDMLLCWSSSSSMRAANDGGVACFYVLVKMAV